MGSCQISLKAWYGSLKTSALSSTHAFELTATQMKSSSLGLKYGSLAKMSNAGYMVLHSTLWAYLSIHYPSSWYVSLSNQILAFTDFSWQPTIIKDMGYTSAKCQLLTIPPYAVAIIFTVGWAVLSERVGRRAPFVIATSTIAIIGYIHHPSHQRTSLQETGHFISAYFLCSNRHLPLCVTRAVLARQQRLWPNKASDRKCNANLYRQLWSGSWYPALPAQN